MTKIVQATGDGACLFNAIAIGLAIEILSGRLDDQRGSRGYRQLLEKFAEHHRNFRPNSWENLKQWLTFYNNARDIELILAPVLFKLNQQYQQKLDSDIVNELTELLMYNSPKIASGTDWHALKLESDFGNALCPKIDNLHISERRSLLLKLKNILVTNEIGLNREKIREFLRRHQGRLLTNLREKILSDPDAFKQGYSCDNLKEMTDALNLYLIENGASGSSDQQIRIFLENRDEHWNLHCSDADYAQYVDRSARKLDITSDDAYKKLFDIPSPSTTRVEIPVSSSGHTNSKKNFLNLLNKIKEKQNTHLKYYSDADQAVTELISALGTAAELFYMEDPELSLKDFEDTCIGAVNQAKEILGSHRRTFGALFAGIKNFFVVLKKILSSSNEPERPHRMSFFDSRTDSAKILEDLSEDMIPYYSNSG